MKTTIETTEGKALVTFEGILDSYIAEEVGEQLVQLYELEDTEITLDCTKLEWISLRQRDLINVFSLFKYCCRWIM